MKSLKVLTIFSLLLVTIVSSVSINKRQTNNIESLLEQLANANNNNDNNNNNANNNNNNQNKEPDSSVRNALRELLNAFQQVASAYVGVLTSLGRAIRVPGIQYFDSPIGLKQIEENIEQMQETVQEITKSINGFFTRGGPQNGNVLMTQLRKFMALWQKQIQDVTSQVTGALGGLEATDDRSPPASSITVPSPFLDFFQQFVRAFQDTFSQLASRVSRLINGNSLSLREESNEPQIIILNQIQQIFDGFQKQIASLVQQLTRATSLEADNTKKDGVSSVPQFIGLKQFQQMMDTFQKQLASVINQFSRVLTGQP